MHRRRSVSVAGLVAPPEDTPSRPLLRLRITGVVVLALFAVLVLRLWSLQVLHARTYSKTVAANAIRTVTLPAPRGLIVGRHGTVLAGNRTENEIVLSRVEASQNPTVIGQVAALVTETPAQVKAALADPQYSPYEPVPILTTAPTTTVQYLENHQAQYPGVTVQQVTQREYPQGGTTAPYVLGYVGAITATELKTHPGYTLAAQIGKSGVEAQYEKYLRGTAGKQRLEVDAAGNVVGTAGVTRPKQGDTVVLNLTTDLEKYAQQALTSDMAADRKTTTSGRTPAATNGAVVVLDARTGAVLALASSPEYSLTTWIGGISTANYQKLSATCHPPASFACPLDDEAIQGLYTPGSTFKLATATAALQDGIIGTTTYIDDTGTYVVPSCTSGCVFHDATAADAGEVNVTAALVRSDDYYFYTMGFRFWKAYTQGKLPEDAIQEEANAYGMGELTGIDIPGEVKGQVATAQEVKRDHELDPKTYPDGTWEVGTNIEMAFGQSLTQLTPIELAQAYMTFVDHGIKYQPEVANEIVSPTGKVVKKFAPKVEGRVAISTHNWQAMMAGFAGVVNTPKGTAYTTFHKDAHFTLKAYPIAGKTGSATVTGLTTKEPNSLFVGFGPTNQTRQYVVVCAISQGGYGDFAAAPVVASVFNYLYSNPVATAVATPTPEHPASTAPPTPVPAIGTSASATKPGN